MNKLFLYYLVLLLSLFNFSCSTTVTNVSDFGLLDNKYDRDYFQVTENRSLDNLVNSIKMINCLAYYESYIFDTDSKLKGNNVEKTDLESIAISTHHITETASGTATIIYSNKEKVALLTCAHILNFPDTIVTYFKNEDGFSSDYIESISIKIKQTNVLPEFTVSNEVEILSIDPLSDIAIVGKNNSSLSASKYIPFGLTPGNSSELSWGTKAYIIGFPLNNKMITTGLVSPSQIRERDYFFVDAVFNRGFSGGIVLAVRDGAPNFEIVGMVKSGTVHRKFNLKPNTSNPNFAYFPQVAYEGEILVEEEIDIKYGVTKIMTIEKILEFMDDNKNAFEELGYDYSKFMKN
jgi:Trypsin-like peptidase domain